ncbi:hypothetical protein [Aliarcobacter skirrowii]|uniref:Uncharacterized protein n=1 Tax=Aliarcobacter skirrowii CCUG 10374 TaxID=1032239 RepID=A0AAD0SQL1_9BACT|nr:hypothetical protein [Aliarcobacter skirrowii]AXX84585.1 hypothetical protein ASKIR_0762 [Aliarcobacter skirrowii CCUG 10374]KAB0619905.1 hypothetical protein F7P70_09605 [Aliarcobacter skirrowii CCUG 10374]RXI24730.1 hypothetical protein CP959_09860 [Aliarcobacter skirrowii CCUG 10374]SUV14747.1 Uncharacterised protein [Aliarcobacter skirrowii]
MPLETKTIDEVLNYCKRDLPQEHDWYIHEFDFIKDQALQESLAREFYTARYIYKLMEALFLEDFELHAHLKFQIIQYASIYEAVINYLLLNNFKEDENVKKISTHISLREIAALSGLTKITYEGNKIFTCLKKETKTPWTSIPFHDKVDASVDIGFVNEIYADEIKSFYTLRNSIHIEAAAKKNIEYEIEQSKLAYRRLRPFIDNIKAFLNAENT